MNYIKVTCAETFKIELQLYVIFLLLYKMLCLPLNLLPLNVLKIIKEYSKPVDWKTFERTINPNLFIEDILDATILKLTPLFLNFRINMRTSTFYLMYIHIEYRGVDSYIQYFGGCKETILSNRWLAIKQKDYEIICY